MFSLSTQCALRRAVTAQKFVCRSCLRFNSSASLSDPPLQDAKPVKSTRPARKGRTIFSGIQPTGIPHLGNYLGALREWVKLQNEAKRCDILLYSIVDLHAVTIKQDPEELQQKRKELFMSLLAIGLDPARSIIFQQSQNPHHAELMWLLSCHASLGYLSRMTQWKSKAGVSESSSIESASNKDNPALKLGLLSYPVLQAADVLLYGTTHVPVGEDQAQHLEFARDLARSFNHAFSTLENRPIFTIPETIISPAKRIMSLKDPAKKMSKSDPDPDSRILITDSSTDIRRKIMGARTDSVAGVSYDREQRPGVSNLIDILCYVRDDGKAPKEVAGEMVAANMSLKDLKVEVATAVDDGLSEIRRKYEDFAAKDPDEFVPVLETGMLKARRLAARQMAAVWESMGLAGWS